MYATSNYHMGLGWPRLGNLWIKRRKLFNKFIKLWTALIKIWSRICLMVNLWDTCVKNTCIRNVFGNMIYHQLYFICRLVCERTGRQCVRALCRVKQFFCKINGNCRKCSHRPSACDKSDKRQNFKF